MRSDVCPSGGVTARTCALSADHLRQHQARIARPQLLELLERDKAEVLIEAARERVVGVATRRAERLDLQHAHTIGHEPSLRGTEQRIANLLPGISHRTLAGP